MIPFISPFVCHPTLQQQQVSTGWNGVETSPFQQQNSWDGQFGVFGLAGDCLCLAGWSGETRLLRDP